MNEMDLLTKIEGLEKAIKEHNDFSASYNEKLKAAKQELIDYNKPELTTSQAEAIEAAISQAVEQFDFDDTENYEIDYSLDYDGRVQCETHEFINGDDLVMEIVTKVCNLFKEVEDEPTANQLNKAQ